MKTCFHCKSEKPESEFHRNKSKTGGLELRCKVCERKRQREYYKQNRRKAQDYRLRSRYGISIDDYDRMSVMQGHKCAICGGKNPGKNKSRFCVDHDHVTGQIRALLCCKCNQTLGLMHDDPDLLEKAADYIRTFRGME